MTTSRTSRRAILAFWLSPLVAPVLISTSGLLLTGGALPGFGELAAQIVTISIYALPVSYAALLVFGVPTLIVLERFGRLNLLWLVACAAVEGFVVLYLVSSLLSGSLLSFWKDEFPLLLLLDGSITAVGVAVAFWYIGGITSWTMDAHIRSAVAGSARPAAGSRR